MFDAESLLPVSRHAVRARAVAWPAIAGMVGPAVFGLIILVLTPLQYDFLVGLGWHPVRGTTVPYPSALALGPYGGLQVLNFVLFGLALIAFARGVHRGIGAGRGSKVGPALLAVAGIGLLLCGFKTEPDVSALPRTLHGQVHFVAFFVAMGAILPVPFVLWRRLRREPDWRGYGRYSLVTGALAILSLFVPGQVAFYLTLAIVLTWLEVLAIRLWVVAGRSEEGR